MKGLCARAVSMAAIVCTFETCSFAATILTRDPAVANLLPREAFEGVGAWDVGRYVIATGHSIRVDSLGVEKGKRTEQNIAEDDCKTRIIAVIARSQTEDFDPEMFDLAADISGFQIAATYRMEGRDGFFLVGLAERCKIKAGPVFNPKKARAFAFNLFHAERFKDAATRFAILTQRDVQDAETVAFARAASWHVNLEAGMRGDARRLALQGLGKFYYDRQDYERSVKYFYDLYKETDAPSRELLATLVTLCEKTRRENSAKAFLRELNDRYPQSK